MPAAPPPPGWVGDDCWCLRTIAPDPGDCSNHTFFMDVGGEGVTSTLPCFVLGTQNRHTWVFVIFVIFHAPKKNCPIWPLCAISNFFD